MAPWRYEISLLVLKKYFIRSLRSVVMYFSTLEYNFRISARPQKTKNDEKNRSMFVQKLSFPSHNETVLVDVMVLELTLTSG